MVSDLVVVCFGFPWGGLICCGFGFVCFGCFTAGMLVLVGLCDLRFDFWFDDLVVVRLGLVLCWRYNLIFDYDWFVYL